MPAAISELYTSSLSRHAVCHPNCRELALRRHMTEHGILRTEATVLRVWLPRARRRPGVDNRAYSPAA